MTETVRASCRLTPVYMLLQAEKIMLESEENKEYLPIQGLEAFNKATAELLLGAGHPAIQVGLGSVQ